MGNKFCDCGQATMHDAGPPGQRRAHKTDFFKFNLTPVSNCPGANSSYNMSEIVKDSKAIIVINMAGM